METLGGKYAGVYTEKLQNGTVSYFIKYRDEQNNSKRIKVGSSPNFTKAKALSALNQRKLEVQELKVRFSNSESNSVPKSLKHLQKKLNTLNDIADFYFSKSNKKSANDEKTKYDYHVRNFDIAKMNINFINDEILNEFYNLKKNARSDGRRAGLNKIDIRFRELEEYEKNLETIKKLSDNENWQQKNYVKYLEEKNKIFLIRNDEVKKKKIMNDKDLSYNAKTKLLGILSPKTIQIIFNSLNSFCLYAFEKERIHSNPFRNFSKKIEGIEKIHNILPRFLREEEVKDFLQEVKYISESNKKYNQLYLMCLLALTTGAREQTILAIKIGDINLNDRTIRLKNFKVTREYFTLISNDQIYNLIEKFSENKSHDDYLFENNNTRVAAYPDIMKHILNYTVNYKYSYLHHLTIKDFRNTVAAHLNIQNVPIQKIQKILDHSDIKMTLRYSTLRKNEGLESLEALAAGFLAD